MVYAKWALFNVKACRFAGISKNELNMRKKPADLQEFEKSRKKPGLNKSDGAVTNKGSPRH
ncbi:hypothetical protein J25TS5_27120 [Paenibacillus faecis]|nr:hypothetical protein J25TS5_27120 [Paenibacillus faecis]